MELLSQLRILAHKFFEPARLASVSASVSLSDGARRAARNPMMSGIPTKPSLRATVQCLWYCGSRLSGLSSNLLFSSPPTDIRSGPASPPAKDRQESCAPFDSYRRRQRDPTQCREGHAGKASWLAGLRGGVQWQRSYLDGAKTYARSHHYGFCDARPRRAQGFP